MFRRGLAVAVVLAVASFASADMTVGMDQSAAGWLGYVNVYELDGTAPLWGNPWGIPDLTANFDDGASTVTLKPAPMNDPSNYWYQGDGETPGGPGVAGNKRMEANLYQEVTDDALAGTTFTFEGEVLSYTLTQDYEAYLFIKDFAADYSSSIETKIPIAAGPFSISATLDSGTGRHVQWGTQVIGANVWPTDVDLFGNAVIATVPEPAALTLLALGGLALLRRR